MIIALCHQVGVEWGLDEEIAHPKAIMDQTYILVLRGYEPVEGEFGEDDDGEPGGAQANLVKMRICLSMCLSPHPLRLGKKGWRGAMVG